MRKIPKRYDTVTRNNSTSCDTDIYSKNKLFDRNKKVIDTSYTTDKLVIQQEYRVF